MKQQKLFGFTIIILCATLLFGCAKPQEQAQESSAVGVEFIMNTWVEQRWYGENSQQTYNDILAALRALEGQLSLYQEDSEISRLNSAAGKQPVALSHETYSLLREAAAYCEQSGGLFDITIAPLTLVWDVTNENPRVPTGQEISEARQLVDYHRIIFDDENQTVMLSNEGMSIDLGGIAKGTAAALMRQYPQKNGVQGYLSIGGNVMVEGKKPDGADYVIGVRDPRGDASEYIATLSLDGLTMATTGDYERYFELDGVRYHHVLDPFTGYPSASDLISVTVVSENGTLADCLSTSIFLSGSGGLEPYLNRDDCMVLAVTRDLDVYASEGLRERLTVNSKKTAYKFHF